MVQTAKFSVEEYHRIVATGALGDRRIELLHGELVELSPETAYHANQNNKIYKYLLKQFDGLADVRSHHPITLASSEPEPDIVLACLPESRYDTRHPEPADIFLVIEVSYSTLDYDLETKQQIYASAGIPDYWVIKLGEPSLQASRSLIQFTDLQGDRYQQCSEYMTGELQISAFPDVNLDVDKLLA